MTWNTDETLNLATFFLIAIYLNHICTGIQLLMLRVLHNSITCILLHVSHCSVRSDKRKWQKTHLELFKQRSLPIKAAKSLYAGKQTREARSTQRLSGECERRDQTGSRQLTEIKYRQEGGVEGESGRVCQPPLYRRKVWVFSFFFPQQPVKLVQSVLHWGQTLW